MECRSSVLCHRVRSWSMNAAKSIKCQDVSQWDCFTPGYKLSLCSRHNWRSLSVLVFYTLWWVICIVDPESIKQGLQGLCLFSHGTSSVLQMLLFGLPSKYKRGHRLEKGECDATNHEDLPILCFILFKYMFIKFSSNFKWSSDRSPNYTVKLTIWFHLSIILFFMIYMQIVNVGLHGSTEKSFRRTNGDIRNQ